MGVYEELVERGLIAQVTDEEEIKKMVNEGKAVFYIGFDPTADSLHVGHFMALCLMKRLQMAGNKPIALIGGGTAMVGDPSGRQDLRKMMTVETIQHNCDCFKKQMARFIHFGEGKDDAIMVNNADWLMGLNYIEFLRDIGVCFSVNKMLAARCYVNRMEQGLTFLEFNYMLMQGYDFYRLYQDYGCNMQFGGDDQWSNMLAGTELIRKKLEKDAHAMTITLLLNSEGKKMGKTANGAVWLDPEKTTPYDFYQYWRNIDDADVIKCIKMLTFLPLDQIHEMEKWEGAELNKAKEILAYELTELVHGKDEAEKAQAAAKALFSGGAAADIPTYDVKPEDFVDGKVELLTLLVNTKLCTSRGDARRNVEQGGVTVADVKITDSKKAFDASELSGDGIIIKRGKKNFVKVRNS
ncbi:MAG: tyrosine--tRNA ligase [Lachnospiraceae bacterium]|nr:tyrosine--tRNA ligase [Lachnospiraceae bacterium]